ncbi:MAG: type 4a pilus biogenesis protein PilO [Candidatus Omnitrophica bacterium]|nr:type 4a pilus biogenesis protein PilO [Candidatus Omnitrophota bacterium]
MKIELTKQRLVISAAVAAAAVLLGAYLILFRPLINKLKLLHSEYQGLETSISRARDAISSLKLEGLKKELVSEADVSLAIEELTKKGKAKGINFISLTPQQIAREPGHYKVLPVDLELEASYAMLGDFLGKLDDLNRSLIRVRKFNLVSNKLNPKILITKLSLDMYFSE